MMMWLGAALLVVTALVFVWVPWWQRNRLSEEVSQKHLNITAFRTRLQELEADFNAGNIAESDYQSLKVELERRVLEEAESNGDVSAVDGRPSPVLVLSLSLVLIAATVGLYQQLGKGQVVVSMEQQRQLAEQLAGAEPAERIRLLEQAVQDDAEVPEYWYFLARFYMEARELAKAEQAYAKATGLVPGDAKMAAEYAQALFFIRGNQMDDSVRVQMEKAVTLDPNNLTIVGMQGVDAFQQGKYAQAISKWQQVLAAGVTGQPAASIQSGIAEAKRRLTEAGQSVPAEAVANGVSVQVSVSLSEALAAKAQPNQRVFIYARAMSGPPMPLAVVTKQVQDLPVTVTLDDSMAMMPQMKLSSFAEVELLARISTSGGANRQPGDLIGSVKNVTTKQSDKTIKILIDQVVE